MGSTLTAWDHDGTNQEGSAGDGTPWSNTQMQSNRTNGVMLPQTPIQGTHPGRLDFHILELDPATLSAVILGRTAIPDIKH